MDCRSMPATSLPGRQTQGSRRGGGVASSRGWAKKESSEDEQDRSKFELRGTVSSHNFIARWRHLHP
jgi:hypothetical protein